MNFCCSIIHWNNENVVLKQLELDTTKPCDFNCRKLISMGTKNAIAVIFCNIWREQLYPRNDHGKAVEEILPNLWYCIP